MDPSVLGMIGFWSKVPWHHPGKAESGPEASGRAQDQDSTELARFVRMEESPPNCLAAAGRACFCWYRYIRTEITFACRWIAKCL